MARSGRNDVRAARRTKVELQRQAETSFAAFLQRVSDRPAQRVVTDGVVDRSDLVTVDFK